MASKLLNLQKITGSKKANEEKRAVRNLVHVADPENVEREIKLWFKPEEIPKI